MRVAFVTSEQIADGREDDRMAAALLGARFELWSDPAVDWERYDRVVIRSPWDYIPRLSEFLDWCERIGPARLRNRPELVAFNIDKRYLGELSVPIVPTTFVRCGDPQPGLDGEVVVKPSVSAGARDTGRFPPDRHGEALALVDRIRDGGRVALVQPYLPGVDARGETAVVYLGGAPSHVLRKQPVLRDSGIAPRAEVPGGPAAAMLEPGLVAAAEATGAELALAAAVHAQVSARFGTPLYARIDLVPDPGGAPLLIELEVIEPRLYFDLAPGSARRFAEAMLADAG